MNLEHTPGPLSYYYDGHTSGNLDYCVKNNTTGEVVASTGGKKMIENDTWYRCTICGREGRVGRCCGDETRIPLNELAREEQKRIKRAQNAEQATGKTWDELKELI